MVLSFLSGYLDLSLWSPQLAYLLTSYGVRYIDLIRVSEVLSVQVGTGSNNQSKSKSSVAWIILDGNLQKVSGGVAMFCIQSFCSLG